MRTGVRSEDLHGGSLGTAFSVLGSSTGDCGVNISLVDPTVLVSSTKNLLVERGVGFTVDLPENPPVSRRLSSLLRPFGNLSGIHGCCYGLGYKALEVRFGQNGRPDPLFLGFRAGT